MKISVSMITMNEEKNIERALSSCSFADEIVVVDGGSTDRTLDILSRYQKVKLIHRPWDNHFGRQRQLSLDHCSGDWVIRLDADEVFSMEIEDNIRTLLSQTGADVCGYKIRQCNLVGNEKYYSKIFDNYENIPRIWRNLKGIKWELPIHEILTGFDKELNIWDVYVVHYGFLDKKRYWQKGEYYAQLPESGFNKAEQLYFREYDIQPRPPESAVAEHVHGYVHDSEVSTRGEIAVIGHCVDIFKRHIFKTLSDTFNLTICLDEITDIDYAQLECSVILFPHNAGGSGELTGLEFELFDKDIICTEGIASPYTYQALLAKLKFGKKVITVVTEPGPVAEEANDDMHVTREIAKRYVDLFIAVSEKVRGALISGGISNGRIVLVPMSENTGERFIKEHESEMSEAHVAELIKSEYLSTFKCAISELSEYSCLTEKDTLKRIRSVYSQQLQEWKGTVGDTLTKNRIVKFYSDTDSYLFDLVQYNYENIHYIQWSQEIFNFCEELNKMRDHLNILDFGGGIGSQLINLSALKDTELSYADVPGKTFEYAKWRFNKRRLDIELIDATEEDFLGNKMYDIVIAVDVIEHLVDPEESVEYLVRHINPDGFLVVLMSFIDNEGEAAWHLNVDKYTNEDFYSLIKSQGMDMMNDMIPRVFRKDEELSGLVENMRSAENGNRPEDARRYVEAYLQLRPVDLHMLIKHTDLCSRMGYKDAAMESLKKIRMFNPEMPELRKLEERIKKENKEIVSCQ